MNEIITAKEAAEITKMSVHTLYGLARRSIIPCSKPNGKRMYFRRSDIENWMMSGLKKESQA